MQRQQHWEEGLHAAAQVPLHFATKATTATAVAPTRWPPRRWGTSGAQKNWGPRGRGSRTSDPLLIVPGTWCLGTIRKGSASWIEEDPGAEKKQRGMGRKRGAREGGARGRGWRAEKEIERGRGEARARESIGAADSKQVSLGKIGQRRLRDTQREKIEDEIERLLDSFFEPQ